MSEKARALRLFLKAKCQSFTWEQKYEPWIPSLMQVGHWSLASLPQPSVSHSRVSIAAMLLLLSVSERERYCLLLLQSSESRGRDSNTTTVWIMARWSIYLFIDLLNLPYCSHNSWAVETGKLARPTISSQQTKIVPQEAKVVTKQHRPKAGVELSMQVERSGRESSSTPLKALCNREWGLCPIIGKHLLVVPQRPILGVTPRRRDSTPGFFTPHTPKREKPSSELSWNPRKHGRSNFSVQVVFERNESFCINWNNCLPNIFTITKRSKHHRLWRAYNANAKDSF